MSMGDADSVPDFAVLYPGADGLVTPRLAACLWSAAGLLADTYEERSAWPDLRAALPAIVVRLVDDAWMAAFVVCFGLLADRLAAGGFGEAQLARCTAEEMALHLVMNAVESLFDGDLVDGWMAELPRAGESDPDFDLARWALFRDDDVLLLFDASLDGVEDPDTEQSRLVGLANLHPRDWFVPFADSEP